MNNQMKYGLAGLIIGGLTVWLLTGIVFNLNKTNIIGVSNNQQMRANSMDAHFIEQMIPHHEDAITMAKLAQAKAKRAEVKQLAENIIDSQGKEINQMKDWYREWYGKDVPQGDQVMGMHGMQQKQGMHMGMMGDETDMTRLEQAEDFDTAFIEEMIPHHQMAVMMASMLKNGTARFEMKKLADDIINAQTKEIKQMREWLNEWGK